MSTVVVDADAAAALPLCLVQVEQLKRSVHAASAFVNNNTRVAASHLREFVRQKHSDVVLVKSEHVST